MSQPAFRNRRAVLEARLAYIAGKTAWDYTLACGHVITHIEDTPSVLGSFRDCQMCDMRDTAIWFNFRDHSK